MWYTYRFRAYPDRTGVTAEAERHIDIHRQAYNHTRYEYNALDTDEDNIKVYGDGNDEARGRVEEILGVGDCADQDTDFEKPLVTRGSVRKDIGAGLLVTAVGTAVGTVVGMKGRELLETDGVDAFVIKTPDGDERKVQSEKELEAVVQAMVDDEE